MYTHLTGTLNREQLTRLLAILRPYGSKPHTKRLTVYKRQ
jgi:hypothetical protein